MQGIVQQYKYNRLNDGPRVGLGLYTLRQGITPRGWNVIDNWVTNFVM